MHESTAPMNSSAQLAITPHEPPLDITAESARKLFEIYNIYLLPGLFAVNKPFQL